MQPELLLSNHPSLLRRFGRAAAAAVLALGAFAHTAGAQSDPYTDVGGGLAGGQGIPVLEGFGSLYPGTTTILRMTNAQPQSLTILSLSFVYTNTPVFGGTAHTLPSALTLTSSTDEEGRVDFPLTIPTGFAPTDFWVEIFVLDPGAPQGIAFTNTVRGSTVSAAVIPDAAAFFDTVRTEAFALAESGHIPWDLYDYLEANAAYLDTHPEAVLDAVTPMIVHEEGTDSFAPQGPGGPTGGGNVTGLTWIWKNIFGVKIASASISVPWTSTTCHSTLGAPAFGGGMPLGSFTVHQVGNKWSRACGPKEQCEQGTSAECGNYQICWKQTFVWFLTLSSGCTKPEVICAPCP